MGPHRAAPQGDDDSMSKRHSDNTDADDRPGSGQRQLRVGESIRHALSEILMRGDLHDPAIAGASITVTEVRMSPDLRNATVFVCPLGGGDAGQILGGLRRASSYLSGNVTRMARLRFAPRLHFEADRSFDQAARISDLLSDEPEPDESDDER